jgi:ABC-2 type transport system permease protein/oleandomycin transport system permease protein
MSVASWFGDAWQMVKRNIIHTRRTPELLLDVTVTPVMFVLLFSFVFGGAIEIPGVDYTSFLMAGIFVQTIAFAGVYTSVLLANDLKNGMIDRFRSLPMHQSSVLVGRTFTDLMRALIAVAIMWGVGLLVGFRPEGELPANVLAVALMLLFGFALSWIGVALGSLVRTPEALQGLIFAVVFPLTFVSSAFVETRTMPDWLAWFADRQPMTLVIDSVRSLTLTGEPGPAFVPAILWSVVPLVVFFPLGVWLYNRRTTQ